MATKAPRPQKKPDKRRIHWSEPRLKELELARSRLKRRLDEEIPAVEKLLQGHLASVQQLREKASSPAIQNDYAEDIKEIKGNQGRAMDIAKRCRTSLMRVRVAERAVRRAVVAERFLGSDLGHEVSEQASKAYSTAMSQVERSLDAD